MSLDTPEEKTSSLGESRDQISEESRAKFTIDGTARAYPGATVLCHLREHGPQSDLYRDIIKQCYDTVIENNELFRNYVQLPKSSLHTTLLDVVVYSRGMHTAGKHPSDSRISTDDVDIDDDEIQRIRAADMTRFRQAFIGLQSEIQRQLPIKMGIDLKPSRLPAMKNTLKVPVKPYDETEANKLHAIRNMLGSAFNLASVNPAYAFHVTVYYPLRAVSDEQFPSLRRDWSEAIRRIAETVPTFELDRVELCEFENMCHFQVMESIH